MRYPVGSDGLAINPAELPVPPSEFDLSNRHANNNHHLQYQRSMYLGSFVLGTVRDLEASQVPLGIDQHNWLHHTFTPPQPPTLDQAMNRLQDAYDAKERLRYGSLYHPTYRLISPPLWRHIKAEHQRYRRLVA